MIKLLIGLLAFGSLSTFASPEIGKCTIKIKFKNYCYRDGQDRPVSCLLTFGHEGVLAGIPSRETFEFDNVNEEQCREEAERYSICSRPKISETGREMTAESIKVKFKFESDSNKTSKTYKHDYKMDKSLNACSRSL
jgi:hypothetical protein